MSGDGFYYQERAVIVKGVILKNKITLRKIDNFGGFCEESGVPSAWLWTFLQTKTAFLRGGFSAVTEVSLDVKLSVWPHE